MASDERHPETGEPVFRLPPRGVSQPEVRRLGYPRIVDPEHPLWEAQQNGWKDWTPERAMREAVSVARNRNSQGYVNSASHPAYDPGYIVNEQASPPAAAVPEAPVEQAEGKRR